MRNISNDEFLSKQAKQVQEFRWPKEGEDPVEFHFARVLKRLGCCGNSWDSFEIEESK